MSELSLGEEILGFDHESGRQVFSAVRAWLHRDPHAEVNMASVVSSVGTLVVSNRHSLAVQSDEGCDSTDCKAYKFAGDLEVEKDSLVTIGGTGVVQKISQTKGVGLYAPLTKTSNFFVGGPGESPAVLAHSFAQLEQPQKYQAAFHLFLDIAEYIWPSINHVEDTSGENYIHPIARMWMRLAGIPTTQDMEDFISQHAIRSTESHGFKEHEDLWDIPLASDVGKSLAERRLTPERRLKGGGGGGGGGSDNTLQVVLYAVVLPPFLRHGIIPDGTPGFAQGMQFPQPTLNLPEWIEEGQTMNVVHAIITAILVTCGVCCSIACKAVAEAEPAAGVLGDRQVYSPQE